MSVNPAIQLSNAVGDIDQLQGAIVDIEARMDAAILAETDEDISALRLELSKLKASLGQARNEEAFWRQQISDELSARKAQADLGKA